MTKEDFVAEYARRSSVSKEWIMDHCEALPCDCGMDGCQGWQMVTKAHLETQKELERAVADGCSSVSVEE